MCPYLEIHACVCVCVCVCVFAHTHVRAKSLQFCPTLGNPVDGSPPSFSCLYRQEYWRGVPCLSPGGLPVLGIEPMSPAAHALQADSLESAQADSEPPGKPKIGYKAIAHVIS